MKIVQCLTRQPIGDKDRWIYPWKEFTGTASHLFSEHEYVISKHRIPSFLSLHTHLAIEQSLETLWQLLFTQFPYKTILLPYDILHGLICAYNMTEILQFWKEN